MPVHVSLKFMTTAVKRMRLAFMLFIHNVAIDTTLVDYTHELILPLCKGAIVSWILRHRPYEEVAFTVLRYFVVNGLATQIVVAESNASWEI
jgi:hypothetical protein